MTIKDVAYADACLDSIIRDLHAASSKLSDQKWWNKLDKAQHCIEEVSKELAIWLRGHTEDETWEKTRAKVLGI